MTVTTHQLQPVPVAVIGAGTIGAGWAAFFALRGLPVTVADVSEHAHAVIMATMERARPAMAALGVLSDTPTIPVVTNSIEAAVKNAVHIQEALPEQLALKHRVYEAIESSASDTAIIASSSSGLQPSQLQEKMRHPQRLLVAHPANPPYLMPLVEIVGGALTATWALDEAEQFYRGLGKETVRLRREVTGHLMNRLQAALWREAVHLVAEGYASVEDVDRTITAGLGARWAICGPHEIFHLAGANDGMAGFLDRLGPAVTTWWDDLGTPVLDGKTRALLIAGMADAAKGKTYAQMATARDNRVIPVMVASKKAQ